MIEAKFSFTLPFQELLKKCHQCMETIVKAKDQQAAEANKNASILLKELDLEKVREELLLKHVPLSIPLSMQLHNVLNFQFKLDKAICSSLMCHRLMSSEV